VLRRIVAGCGFAGRSWGTTKHLQQNKLCIAMWLVGAPPKPGYAWTYKFDGKKRHGSKRAHLMPQHAAKANSRSSHVLRYMAE